MFEKPGFVTIVIFALINYILCAAFFMKEGLITKKHYVWKIILIVVFAVFYLLFIISYADLCSLNGYPSIIFIFIVSLIFLGIIIGKPCDSKYTFTFKDVEILASMTSFYIILGLTLLKLLQYKFLDFIPLPHLSLTPKDILTLMKHLVGFISIFSVCPFSGVVEALKNAVNTIENIWSDDFKNAEIFQESHDKTKTPLAKDDQLEFDMKTMINVIVSLEKPYVLLGFGLAWTILFIVLIVLHRHNTGSVIIYSICIISQISNLFSLRKEALKADDDKTKKKKMYYKMLKSTNGFITWLTIAKYLFLLVVGLVLFLFLWLFLLLLYCAIHILSVLSIYLHHGFGIPSNITCSIIRFVLEGKFYIKIWRFLYDSLEIGVTPNTSEDIRVFSTYKRSEKIKGKDDYKGETFRSPIYEFLYHKFATYRGFMDSLYAGNDLFNPGAFKGDLESFPMFNGLKVCNIDKDNECKNISINKFLFKSKDKNDNTPEKNTKENTHLLNAKSNKYTFNKGTDNPTQGSKKTPNTMVTFKIANLICSMIIIGILTSLTGYQKLAYNMLTSFLDDAEKVENFENKSTKNKLSNSKSKPKKYIKSKQKPKPHKKKLFGKKQKLPNNKEMSQKTTTKSRFSK